jgi:hypothetical protein
MEDQEEEVGKVEHVRQVKHLEVAAHPEHGNNCAARCGICARDRGDKQKHMKGFVEILNIVSFFRPMGCNFCFMFFSSKVLI